GSVAPAIASRRRPVVVCAAISAMRRRAMVRSRPRSSIPPTEMAIRSSSGAPSGFASTREPSRKYRSHARQPPCTDGSGSAANNETTANNSTPGDRSIRVYSYIAKDDRVLIARLEERQRAHGHRDVEHEHSERAAIGRPGTGGNGLC